MIAISETKDNGEQLATVPLVEHEYEMFKARAAIRFWRNVAFLAISILFALLVFGFVR